MADVFALLSSTTSPFIFTTVTRPSGYILLHRMRRFDMPSSPLLSPAETKPSRYLESVSLLSSMSLLRSVLYIIIQAATATIRTDVVMRTAIFFLRVILVNIYPHPPIQVCSPFPSESELLKRAFVHRQVFCAALICAHQPFWCPRRSCPIFS